MRCLSYFCWLVTLSTATIFENGRERETHFVDTKISSITSNSTGWKTFGPNATELSYKGRWDSNHVSWWAAPGLKFAFTGQNLAITFGPQTTDTVLIAYRLSGLDWQLTNLTTGATHHLIRPTTPGLNATLPTQLPLTFELRVTNWGYGVQISGIHLSPNATLIKVPDYGRRIEFIGDSLTSGYSATYEAFSGFGYNIGAGLGDTEFSITAFPGICLHDAECWGNPRGQEYQWFRTSDTSGRAQQAYGEEAPLWDFGSQPAADIVFINIGTNDANSHNPVTPAQYLQSYIDFVPKVHEVYPRAQIVLCSLWGGFGQSGNTYKQGPAFEREIYEVYKTYEGTGYWHPTDVGHIKIAAHVIQYIRLKFGWELAATGPEVQHETLYWNDEVRY
ncbi:hypothetical protein K458DRAFT_461912 [Lentithecium fluviatile CBS 122367]|uniref:SGNH hydrolase-type esterase domain-containing protein n=1 Tax=Lentithecium fluviatile CBS 122367 TaxID=1168545 RepID=A0A6G1JG07_9PLEO|nr:hypothetical protein K458DRAFT_461912 [Lentithecium fluviatile CBS 122367]